jgi:AraC-like DNA-binding protein
MTWSLSEFLNLFEFRSQSWCFVDLAPGHGLRVPHGEAALFYAVLDGQARLTGAGSRTTPLKRGDIAIVLSGEAHAIRQDPADQLHSVSLLETGGYVDSPPAVMLGAPPTTARMLCGRLKVRWPAGKAPPHTPPLLLTTMAKCVIDFDRLVPACRTAGGSSLLTRMATMIFVDTFRQDAACQRLFRDSENDDPIGRAQRLIELHPFQKWSVEILGRKVGMSRSNFAARFVGQTGMTPMEAVTAQRMRQAADLLNQTDLKIAEISERVGYSSEAAFYARFTSHFGIPPGQMRRQDNPG